MKALFHAIATLAASVALGACGTAGQGRDASGPEATDAAKIECPTPTAAHPAVVKRTVVKEYGESTTLTSAMCNGSQAECGRLVARFNAADSSTDQMPRQGNQPTAPAMRGSSRY
ncbi:MAG TPA: hypothetical protein VMG60_08310 [Burkholderiaceae bacterium]|nr:hypothetical protein [Burkholderiaceae bacterium]